MAVTPPKIGEVILYGYLWRNQHAAGQIEALKYRPCVVLDTKQNADGSTLTFVAPITHTRPNASESSIQINPGTARRVGLDDPDTDKWLITSEVNQFTWPGPDRLPVTYRGPMPAKLVSHAAEKFVESGAVTVERKGHAH